MTAVSRGSLSSRVMHRVLEKFLSLSKSALYAVPPEQGSAKMGRAET